MGGVTPGEVRQRLVDWFGELVPLWLLPRGLPGWPVAVGLGLALALLVGAALGPRLGIARARLMLWLAALLMVPAYTWTVPNTADRLPDVWEMCVKGYLPQPSMLLSGVPQEVVANVLLLVPAGAAAVMWPLGAQRLAALAVALAVSPVVEAVQLVPAMHRGCQVGDVVNNSIGVVVGFALATALESLWRSVVLVRSPSPGSRSGTGPPPGSTLPDVPATARRPAPSSSPRAAEGVRIRGRDA